LEGGVGGVRGGGRAGRRAPPAGAPPPPPPPPRFGEKKRGFECGSCVGVDMREKERARALLDHPEDQCKG
jgi:hypothetical protein